MKPMHRLRVKMMEADMTQTDMAKAIDRGISYVSTRMNGKNAFSAWEMHKIGKLLEIPPEELCLYFPPCGNKNRA